MKGLSRDSRRLIIIVLSLLLIMTTFVSCKTETTTVVNSAADPAVMADNYQAEMAWIRLESIPELGDGIVYRQIKDMKAFMQEIEEPVVFCLVQYDHALTSMAVPYLERLAEQNSGVAVVLAKQSAKDSYLEQFTPRGWPAFYLINKEILEGEYFGIDEKMKTGVTAFINKHLKN